MTNSRFSFSWSVWAFVATCSCACGDTSSTPVVKNPDLETSVHQAITRNHLTSLAPNCLQLERSSKHETPYFEIYIREKHDEQCGGDPETAPLLFTVRIDRNNQAMSTNANSDEEEFKPIK